MALTASRIGTATSKTSGTSLVCSLSSAAVVGAKLVVQVVADNITETTPTFTLADTGSNTWASRGYEGYPTTADDGVVMEVFTATLTTGLAIGDTITVTLSAAVTARAMQVILVEGGGYTSAWSPEQGSPTPSISASVTAGHLVIACLGLEQGAGSTFVEDADTTGGAWTSLGLAGTSGSPFDSNVTVASAYKVATSTGTQTYNPTTAGTHWVGMAVVYSTTDAAPPTVTLDDPTPAGQTTGYEHVSGTVQLTWTADDDVGVTKVDLEVDGVSLQEDATGPYAWDTTVEANGYHDLTAIAWDAAGNSTTSTAVGVIVNNEGRWAGPSVAVTTYGAA